MVYRVIGCMSGSSMDGLDVAYCVLSDVGGNWSCEIEAAESVSFSEEWNKKLQTITEMSARELLQTHADFGHYIGEQLNIFIKKNSLQHKVHFVASHGHTVFHSPSTSMTFQMGDGASIAAELELPVITDLRNMDVAFGGQGAPVVPIAEKLLWSGYHYFLNLGGIANISFHADDKIVAFDICPANRVLNDLVNKIGKDYDDKGKLAETGNCNEMLLEKLNALDYYQQSAPKSLANEFGTETMLPMINQYEISLEDKLATMVEHIAIQISNTFNDVAKPGRLLVTGGGAHNDFLLKRIESHLAPKEIEVEKPEHETIEFKEAISMAIMGALRWREEENVLASVTGARQNSIGGALWMGRN